jgi:hypothetical protein
MIKFTEIQFYVALFAIFYFIFDLLFLRRYESDDRSSAAKIQEMFDIDLFGISWNDVVADSKVDEEKIISCADNYKKKNKNLDNLYDWYPKCIADVDMPVAIAICQRINIWWDVNLRKKLFWSIIFFIVLLTLVLFVFGKNLANSVFFLFPMLPFYEVIINYAISQSNSIKRILNLKNKIEKLLDDKKLLFDEIKASILLRSIQDEIFRHRESCIFIPDWFYKLFRNKQEDQMNYSAQYYIDNFNNKQ